MARATAQALAVLVLLAAVAACSTDETPTNVGLPSTQPPSTQPPSTQPPSTQPPTSCAGTSAEVPVPGLEGIVHACASADRSSMTITNDGPGTTVVRADRGTLLERLPSVPSATLEAMVNDRVAASLTREPAQVALTEGSSAAAYGVPGYPPRVTLDRPLVAVTAAYVAGKVAAWAQSTATSALTPTGLAHSRKALECVTALGDLVQARPETTSLDTVIAYGLTGTQALAPCRSLLREIDREAPPPATVASQLRALRSSVLASTYGDLRLLAARVLLQLR